ncbi:hypothetical protein BK126_26210 [Paenibacillus sp. FSL H7-0326]|uniref:hypothetical protein n=1 Tax=Paenibacillus sp. FSL H7-0326 TaxID=1921144 RepID=UPI00096C5D65|nr:hypothetical protein [Paenibacillus sp. FSL H7-0326]OMC63690.1 hypothetical protein BK126_26210 [Paenibacillus sp. FSL H7-0326]
MSFSYFTMHMRPEPSGAEFKRNAAEISYDLVIQLEVEHEGFENYLFQQQKFMLIMKKNWIRSALSGKQFEFRIKDTDVDEGNVLSMFDFSSLIEGFRISLPNRAAAEKLRVEILEDLMLHILKQQKMFTSSFEKLSS